MFESKREFLTFCLATALLAVTLIGGCVALSAPIPPVKPKRVPPPLQVVAGSSVLLWNGINGQMTLGADGWYEWKSGIERWFGNWTWDDQARLFSVTESNGIKSYAWSAVLSSDLRGTAHERGGWTVRVHIKRAKVR